MKSKRESLHHYRRWCKHLKELGLKRRRFAKHQWNLYWDGCRNQKLSDAAFWLIDQFGY